MSGRLRQWFTMRLQRHKRLRVFDDIRRNNFWGGKESVSGPGSDLEATAMLRRDLPMLLDQLQPKRLLDVPCGDFHWMQHLPLDGLEYIGGDLLPSLIERNRILYGTARRRFMVVDLCAGPLPDADLLLVRDCLGHLSFADIERAFRVIRTSRVAWVLLTHFTVTDPNIDIPTGRWRPLNFTKPPFSMPEPHHSLPDGWPDGDPIYEYKTLSLWRRDDLPESLNGVPHVNPIVDPA